MLNTIIQKPITNFDEYSKCAQWCNENMAKIVDKGDYYEVVDNHPTEDEIKQFKETQLKAELKVVTQDIAQLQGASVCGMSIDDTVEYDILKDGELVTMNEGEFNNYFDELTDKRNDIVKQLKGL